MLFVPVAGYFLDFHSVLGITGLFHVISNVSKIVLFKKGYDKKLVIQLGIPAVVFVILGAYISRFLNTQFLEIALAIFLIIISVLLLVFNEAKLKPTTANAVGGGVISGLIAGMLGTGGAIRGITLAAFNLKTEVFIATSAIIDLGVDISRSVVYAANGYVHRHDLYLIPVLLVVSIVGTYAGKWILLKMTEKQFRQVVLVLILITGLSSIIKVIAGFN